MTTYSTFTELTEREILVAVQTDGTIDSIAAHEIASAVADKLHESGGIVWDDAQHGYQLTADADTVWAAIEAVMSDPA